MDLRLKFDEDEANYDQWRPTYVPRLFADIIAYAKLDQTKDALEIGLGTGQATLPILQTGCQLTAIEIGAKLAAYARRKFASFANLTVIHDDFEKYSGVSGSFDLIYSATAFHWIPAEVGYPRVFDLLKSGGTLALFWNHPFVNRQDPLHMAIQKVYNQYRPSEQPKNEFCASDCAKILDTLQQYGFLNRCSKLYYQTRTFTAPAYIALLNTYSDHRAMPEQAKKGLEQGIALAIDAFGGKLQVYDTMDLYLAQKP